MKKNVVLAEAPQPWVLQEKMQEKNLTHGDKVRADIPNVYLQENSSGSVDLFLCKVPRIDLHENMGGGDGGEIPDEVVLVDELSVDFKGDGYYDLREVLLDSNGSIQLSSDNKTHLLERVLQPS